MGTAGAKAFGDMLLVNKTIQTLDVSDNSFGKPQVGDQVKIKSSGEIKVVKFVSDTGQVAFEPGPWTEPVEYEWKSQVPAFCAGVAASPSLLSVSTIFCDPLAVSISHASPLIPTMYVARCFQQRNRDRNAILARFFFRSDDADSYRESRLEPNSS
jgi:hypothetical protein